MKIHRNEAVAAVCNRMDALHLRHSIVFTPHAASVPISYTAFAEALIDDLAQGSEAAVIVARALVDPSDLESGPFWAMSLGRLLFLAGGWREERMPQSVAASVLGCSRQWVNTLIRKGVLSHNIDGLVFRDEVISLLKSYVDRDVN